MKSDLPAKAATAVVVVLVLIIVLLIFVIFAGILLDFAIDVWEDIL